MDVILVMLPDQRAAQYSDFLVIFSINSSTLIRAMNKPLGGSISILATGNQVNEGNLQTLEV
jgi:hypothetical protein